MIRATICRCSRCSTGGTAAESSPFPSRVSSASGSIPVVRMRVRETPETQSRLLLANWVVAFHEGQRRRLVHAHHRRKEKNLRLWQPILHRQPVESAPQLGSVPWHCRRGQTGERTAALGTFCLFAKGGNRSEPLSTAWPFHLVVRRSMVCRAPRPLRRELLTIRWPRGLPLHWSRRVARPRATGREPRR